MEFWLALLVLLHLHEVLPLALAELLPNGLFFFEKAIAHKLAPLRGFVSRLLPWTLVS